MPLKKNQIHQGDCVKLLAKLKPESVDMVFADPPFNIGYDYDVYDDSQSSEKYLQWCGEWIRGVHRALKSDGTFWLAIGDTYAAELKIEAQKAGFHCRSWVIWYYTFGVNCVNGFSRSHTHIFHFVKDKKKFTFNRSNPQIRVKSARQLVYADNRANPAGRLPDNTWIIRPQDAPESFSPNHDTWYFTRVAGTFKEREGFHGCQMPEQLLARIIRSSSNPQDLVLDPFGGSGTTLCVAKKLARQWMGFELSEEYVKHIGNRLEKTGIGDAIDGPEDPIESAPSTAKGKRRKKGFDDKTIDAVVESYLTAGEGYPVDYLLCDKDLNKRFIDDCLSKGIGGNATVWNRLLLSLRKSKKLPASTKRVPKISTSDQSRYSYASEVAWRLIEVDFGVSLDEMFCSPESAAYFDRIASEYGPQDAEISSTDYRRAAIAIRKQARSARRIAAERNGEFSKRRLSRVSIEKIDSPKYECPGVFVIASGEVDLFAGEASNLRQHVTALLDNPRWESLEPDSVLVQLGEAKFSSEYMAMKSAVVAKRRPLLNSNVWMGS
ncbi:DNA-methyltransferase [Mariniblastus fucicola]|uniref:DNA adenine methyltransferase YhdJ n=1 Tax=Mariniblastus fucicola TaxID=980251 RepID=A0A5B9PG47_9BACT|nr:site-specific DNA-methyltransferase [Mariniblastus fucicola]QEG24210.1 DNA adenine methyltransferase YhdJ [Mariniblastus fucicola]